MKTYTTPVLTDDILNDIDNDNRDYEIVSVAPAIVAAVPAVAAVVSAVTAVAEAVTSVKGKNVYMETESISSLDKVD